MDLFDLELYETGVEATPIQTTQLESGEKLTILDGVILINNKLCVGNPPNYPTSLGNIYCFPSEIGLAGQVLVANPTLNQLEWKNQTEVSLGNVINGGQPDELVIGTTSTNDFSLVSGGKIIIGNNTTDTIHIQGGIRYQYDAISDTTPPGGNTIDLLLSNYFVEITGIGITTVRLPDADGAVSGHMYIISKGYDGGILTLKPGLGTGDTIDGLTQVNLVFKDQRIKVISSGANRWLII
jgi:hypothetical protein